MLSSHAPILRILVCDRLPIMREAICGLISNESNMNVVGSTDNGMHALSMIRATHPHVVVTGMETANLTGLDLIHRLGRENIDPVPRIIALAVIADDNVLTKMIHAGVSGVLAEEATHSEVIAAINAAAAGHTTLAPQVTALLVNWFRRHNGHFEEQLASAVEGLTGREREVLMLIANGRSMGQVAKDLCIEMTTVRTHVYRMRCKLDIRDRAQLVSFAYRAGLMQV